MLAVAPGPAQDDYQPGPDSLVQPGVPHGELSSFVFDRSRIFPGTVRTCDVYVPAQYTPDRPACLYVGQDGVVWNAPTVFDNLIAKREMPVTIGVFVTAGVLASAPANAPIGRRNRTQEYSSLNDDYVRFLLDDLLPAVEARTTADGRPIRISKEAKDRAIAGSSAGGTAAFTAAWLRPDAFSRVFSSVGGFGLYSGESYPTLILKFEPRPLRIFLQDGSNDGGGFAGNWWMANQTMAHALEFAGYEERHDWGTGGHATKHATAVFPDAMRWLWKDWPQPVRTGATRNELLNAILIPGEGWQLVGEGYERTEGVAANRLGEVFFTDAGAGRGYRVGADGKATPFAGLGRNGGGAALGRYGSL
jgi:enterochelin esterase-like enzyme